MRREAVITGACMAARFALFVVLVYAGVSKLSDPRGATRFMESLLLFRSATLVFILGVIEISIGVALFVAPTTMRWAVISALLFSMFASVHAYTAFAGVTADCGCFGSGAPAKMSPGGWIAMNLALAFAGMLLATSATNRGGMDGRPRVVSDGASPARGTQNDKDQP